MNFFSASYLGNTLFGNVFTPEGSKVFDFGITFPIVLAVKLHADNKHLFIGAPNGDVIVATTNGNCKTLFNVRGLTAFALSDDGDLFAGGTTSGRVEVWQLGDKQKGIVRKLITVFSKHAGLITTMTFMQDSRYLMTGSTDQLLYTWDAETGNVLNCCEGHSSQILDIATMPGPSCITIGGLSDGTAKRWDVITGYERQSIMLAPSLNCVAFDANTQNAYIGDRSGAIRCWDLQTNKIRWENTALNTQIVKIIISRQPTYVIVGTYGSQICILHPATGEIVRQAPITGTFVELSSNMPVLT